MTGRPTWPIGLFDLGQSTNDSGVLTLSGAAAPGPMGLNQVAPDASMFTDPSMAASSRFMIDTAGIINNSRIKLALNPSIERGDMVKVTGIIVHQTGAPNSSSTFNSYARPEANGAHFLIDKDGTIYQTASLRRITWHVGRLRSRCLAEHRCSPAELKALKRFDPAGEHRREIAKGVPNRYPSNTDSIGIELVGEALPRGTTVPEEDKTYEEVSKAQNEALAWLVGELSMALDVPLTEVFRHPVVSRKNPTEAATAKW